MEKVVLEGDANTLQLIIQIARQLGAKPHFPLDSSDDEDKKQTALKLLDESPVISIQVLKENTNICLRKFKMSVADTRLHLSFLQHYASLVSTVLESTIHKALDIKERYQYGFYDSLIIASALEQECTILYSEDMQNGQIIEGTLEIKNPFFSPRYWHWLKMVQEVHQNLK